jgi:hypothetical protein
MMPKSLSVPSKALRNWPYLLSNPTASPTSPACDLVAGVAVLLQKPSHTLYVAYAICACVECPLMWGNFTHPAGPRYQFLCDVLLP